MFADLEQPNHVLVPGRDGDLHSGFASLVQPRPHATRAVQWRCGAIKPQMWLQEGRHAGLAPQKRRRRKMKEEDREKKEEEGDPQVKPRYCHSRLHDAFQNMLASAFKLQTRCSRKSPLIGRGRHHRGCPKTRSKTEPAPNKRALTWALAKRLAPFASRRAATLPEAPILARQSRKYAQK